MQKTLFLINICSLDLASVNEFCPNQCLLYLLQSDDFPTLTLLPCLSVGTWHFTFNRSPPFSPLSFFIYLYIVLDSWVPRLFQWFIYNLLLSLILWCSNCPILGQKELLQADSNSFTHSFIHSFILVYFLIFLHKSMFEAHLMPSHLWNQHVFFSEECYF